MSLAEQESHTEHSHNIDSSAPWRSSNIEPLRRVLVSPELSLLQVGIPMLDRVMFACSNTELKSVMILYGLDSAPTHRGKIHARFAPLLPDSWDSRPQPGNIVRMMRTFIVPPGFAQEPIEYSFATTPLGETVGKNSAAFLLQQAVNLRMALGPILQERTEEDTDIPTRAYVTRIATLIALKSGPLSQAELQERIGGETMSLAWNLRVLAERKLILYDSENPEVKGQQIYERADLSKAPEKVSILAKNILRYFEVNGTGNQYTIARALGREHTQDIGKTLRQLMRVGALTPPKPKSEAKILPSGKRFIDELIVPLLLAYSGNEGSLHMLAQVRAELEGNPAIATTALDQYKKQRILIPEAETQQAILALIRESGPQRRNQIITQIGKMTHPQLIELVVTGQLKTTGDGNASFYVLPDTDEQPTRTEEIIIIDFSPPSDLFDIQEHRKVDKYRRELDTVDFWKRVQRELQHVPADRYTARDFFLKYDPQYKDWRQRYYSGIFSNYVRALWSLGIERPEEFIRTYRSEGASSEVQEAIVTAQDLINKVFPTEGNSRIFNRRYIDRLENPEFWRELMADAQSVPSGTKIESFMLRFDPDVEGKMKPSHQYGKYYPLRSMVRMHTNDTVITLLTGYRPPEGTPLETLLAVRETQAVLRQHLRVHNLPPDDFSDIDELKKRQAAEIQKRREIQSRMASLKAFFERFQDFSETEMVRLGRTTVEEVRRLRTNIKGQDIDEASFASIGFETKKYDGGELVADPFPAELRAAYLVFAFEQSRNGKDFLEVHTYSSKVAAHTRQWTFKNGEVRAALAILERYLAYYEGQGKKTNPNAVFPTSILINQLIKYVQVSI